MLGYVLFSYMLCLTTSSTFEVVQAFVPPIRKKKTIQPTHWVPDGLSTLRSAGADRCPRGSQRPNSRSPPPGRGRGCRPGPPAGREVLL